MKESKKSEGRGLYFFLGDVGRISRKPSHLCFKKTNGQCPKVAETGLDDFKSFVFTGSNRYDRLFLNLGNSGTSASCLTFRSLTEAN